MDPLKLLIVCLSFHCHQILGSYVHLVNNSYTNLVFYIDSKVPANNCQQLKLALGEAITELSDSLWTALDARVYFSNVTVIGPSTWRSDVICSSIFDNKTKLRPHQADFLISDTDVVFGDQVYTKQYGGCGVAGLPTVITYKTFVDNTTIKEKKGIMMLHHWAKRRYGVFDEVGIPRDAMYPSGYEYIGSNYGYQPSTCANLAVQGKWMNGTKECDFMEIQECSFDPGLSNEATSSIMFNYEMPQVSRFCSVDHDARAPTKHNFICSGKNVLSVINSHPDFQKPFPTSFIQNVSITYALAESTLSYIIVIDRSNYITPTMRNTIVSALSHFFVLLPTKSRVAIVTYDSDCDLLYGSSDILDTQLAQLRRLNISTTNGTAGLTCALRWASKIAIHQEDIILITAQPNKPDDYENLLQELKQDSLFVISLVWNPFIELWKLAEQGRLFAVLQQKNVIENTTAPPIPWLSSLLQEVYNLAKYDLKRQKVHENPVPVTNDTQYTSQFEILDGKSERVMFTFFPQDMTADLQIKLVSPGGLKLPATNETEFRLVDVLNPNEGTWSYTISPSIKGHVDVWKESTSRSSVSVRTWTDAVGETIDPKLKPWKVYAEVLNQGKAVHEATVTCQIYADYVVDGSTTPKDRVMQDTGDGIIDLTRGDGIYSVVIPPSDNMFLSVNSLNAIIVKVLTTSISYTTSGLAVNRALAGSTVQIPNGIRINTTSIMRIVYGSAIRPKLRETAGDFFPPAPIRDLTIVDIDYEEATITFQWTLPKDDYGTATVDVKDLTFVLTQTILTGETTSRDLNNVSTFPNGKVGCKSNYNATEMTGLEVTWRVKSIDAYNNPSEDSNTVNLAIGGTTVSTRSTSPWSSTYPYNSSSTPYPQPAILSSATFWSLLGVGIFIFLILLIFLLMICFCEEFTRLQLKKVQCLRREKTLSKTPGKLTEDNLVHNDFVRRSTRSTLTQTKYPSVHDIAHQGNTEASFDNPVFTSPSITDDDHPQRRSTPHAIAAILKDEDQGYQRSGLLNTSYSSPVTFRRNPLPALPQERQPNSIKKHKRSVPPPPPLPPSNGLPWAIREERVYDVPFAEKLRPFRIASSSSSSSSEKRNDSPSLNSFAPPQNELGLPSRPIVVRSAPVVPAPRTRAPHMGANSLSSSLLSLSNSSQETPKLKMEVDRAVSYV